MARTSTSADAIRLATRRPGRFPHASMGMIFWLTLVWVMLWGNFTVGNVLAGFIVALVVTTVTPFPVTPFDGRFRPLGVLHLVARFLLDIVHSSFQQVAFILSGKKPHGAIIRIHLRSHSDVYLTIISAMTALVPGSVVVEAHRSTGTLYVHVFDTGLAGGIDGVHETVMNLEERVLRAFASHDELIDAGFVPGSKTSAGRLPIPFAPATGDNISEEPVVEKADEGDELPRSYYIAGNKLQGDLEAELEAEREADKYEDDEEESQ